MIFTNSYAANSWDSVAKSQEKGFLILSLLPGWHGLGKQQHSFYLLFCVL